MTICLSSRFTARATVKMGVSSQRGGVITLGQMPVRRYQTQVIEMQSRKPGEAGAQLRQITRPSLNEDTVSDYEYE